VKSENTSKRISLFYLFAVPFLVAAAGFGIGKISPAKKLRKKSELFYFMGKWFTYILYSEK